MHQGGQEPRPAPRWLVELISYQLTLLLLFYMALPRNFFNSEWAFFNSKWAFAFLSCYRDQNFPGAPEHAAPQLALLKTKSAESAVF